MFAERSRRVAAFIAKLNDSVRVASPKELAEAAETQTWINFAVDCGYISDYLGREFYARYNQILSGLVNMINNPSPWLITRK
jgi:hypothetical protein